MRLQKPRHSPARAGKLRATHGTSDWSRGLRAAGPVLALLAVFSDQALGAAAERGRLRLAQRTEPRIWVAAEFLARPASEVALPIRIAPPGTLPRNSFIRLRGLPYVVSLNEGYSIGPGAWAIPLQALPTLKATIPAAIAGRSELVISVLGADGIPLAEARTVLIVEPVPTTGMATQPQPAAPSDPPRQVPTAPPVSPGRKSYATPWPAEVSSAERQKAEQLVKQGDQYLAQGKVGGARLFYRQAASAGFALGAIRLGTTFDPTELSRLQVEGITPDAAEARKWYERARELGAPEADERLARLSDY
jgi:hypothetical protein